MSSVPAASRRWLPRTRRRRVALAVSAGLATFILLLVLDGIWAGSQLVRGLTGARAELSVAIESVVTGDAEAARPHFLAAHEAADEALGAVGHPSLGIARLLPVIRDNIDAAAAVAEASRETAEVGATLVDVARALRWSDIGLPASTAAGDLDVAAFEEAIPGMESVADRLRTALTSLKDAGRGRLIGPVASGYRDAVEGLTRRADLAARFRDALRLIPTMFGGDGPRRYLVCVPALGVPRPGGGAPASVGILVAQGGALRMNPLVPAPRAFAVAETSPDWPATARAFTEAATRAGFPRLDGVLLFDARALEDLVWVTGDVPVPGRALPLSDATTTAALEIDAFLGTLPGKTARLHASWASAIFERFLTERPALESFALATAIDTRDRHLAVYLTDRREQRAVRAVGLDGRARLGGVGVLPLVATWTTTGTAHVGALVDTAVQQDVIVQPDGSASVETEVLFQNGAGTDPPSVLLGRPASGVPVGTFVADVSLYLPADARDVVAETSRPSPIEVGRDHGLGTVTGSIAVRGGESTTLTVTYALDEVARRIDGANELLLRLVPQPTIEGLRYQIRVVLPDGSIIGRASPEFERRGTRVVFSGVRSGPLDLELRYA